MRFMIFTLEYIVLGILGLLLITLIGWVIRLEMKLRRVLLGKNAKSLEDSIIHLTAELTQLNTFKKESEAYYKNIEKRLSRSIQGVETVRFNAFKGEGIGGNQSFATAFLNEEGNGAVISSLYSRDRISIFEKPIKKLVSEFELSEEERNVITKGAESVKGR
jgi:hypothetical protein